MKWSKVNQGDRRWHGKGERKLNEADQGQEFSTVKGFSLIFQPGYAIHTLPMINSSRMSYCVWTRRCLNRIWLTMGGGEGGGGYFRDKRLNIASGREVCQLRNFFPPLPFISTFPPRMWVNVPSSCGWKSASLHPPILPRPCRENSVSVWPNVAILLSILYIISIETANGCSK